MQLPRYSTGYDPDYASSLSSLISSAAGSTLSGEEDDVDNSVYSNGSSRDDDSSDEDDDDDYDGAVQIASVSGGTYEESSISTTEAEWPGLTRPDFDALSAEQQLQSLQEGRCKEYYLVATTVFDDFIKRSHSFGAGQFVGLVCSHERTDE